MINISELDSHKPLVNLDIAEITKIQGGGYQIEQEYDNEELISLNALLRKIHGDDYGRIFNITVSSRENSTSGN